MSKYNLTELHNENIKEGTSRGGTINDSWYSISNTADEIDGENLGKETYPIHVQHLGPSSDGKTNDEISVRYGEGHREYFTIYDYKFGEDPTDEVNYQNDYPFSLGLPIGNKDGKQWAAKLGFNVESMNENITKLESDIVAYIADVYIQNAKGGDKRFDEFRDLNIRDAFQDVVGILRSPQHPLHQETKKEYQIVSRDKARGLFEKSENVVNEEAQPYSDENRKEEADGLAADIGLEGSDAQNFISRLMKATDGKSWDQFYDIADDIMPQFMSEGNEDVVNEEEGFTEVSEKEIRFHLDAYRAGTIDGDDLAQAIEEIVFGDIKAPFKEEASQLREHFKRFL